MSKDEALDQAVEKIKNDVTADQPKEDSEQVTKLQDENKKLKDQIIELQSKVKELQSSNDDLTKLPLAVKIARANREMGALRKDGNNSGQGFDFISESQIKSKVRELEGKYGFTIISKKTEIVDRYEKKTSRGGLMYFYDVLETFNIVDEKESYEGQMLGTGSDTGDKAVNKAVTIALKNFEKQLFNVSDQEDPDAQSTPTTYSQDYQQPRQRQQRQQKPDRKTQLANMKVNWEGKQVTLAQVLAGVRRGNTNAMAFANSFKGELQQQFDELSKLM